MNTKITVGIIKYITIIDDADTAISRSRAANAGDADAAATGRTNHRLSKSGIGNCLIGVRLIINAVAGVIATIASTDNTDIAAAGAGDGTAVVVHNAVAASRAVDADATTARAGDGADTSVGVGDGAGDGLLREVGAGRFRWCYWRRAWVATLFMSRA